MKTITYDPATHVLVDKETLQDMIETIRGYIHAAAPEVEPVVGQHGALGDNLVACANCLRPKCEHSGKYCPKPFTTLWHAWGYTGKQPDFPEYAATPAPAADAQSVRDATWLYEALRAMHWTDKKLAVVEVKDVPLGAQTYSGDMLDEAILAATKGGE